MKQMPVRALILAQLIAFNGLSCAKDVSTDLPADNSASGAAAAVIAGAVNSTSSAGMMAFHKDSPKKHGWDLGIPSASAATSCPTPNNGVSGCSATGGILTLTYNSCSFGDSTAVWSGGQVLQASSGTFAANCGSYLPTGQSSNWSITRTFTGSIGNTPTTRAEDSGITVEIDTSNHVSTYNQVSGINGGVVVGFSGTARTTIKVPGIEVHGTSGTTSVLDHTVTTNGGAGLTIDDSGTNKIVNGTLTVYHNLALATGTSTFNQVTFSPGCCNPTSGTVTTTYTSTSAKFSGKTETLTFNGCNKGLIANVDNSTQTVTLPSCF